MKATDLRIGNLVIENGKLKKLHSISAETAKDYSKVEPIPLTEEWLLKFGFIRVKSANYDFELQIQKDNNEGAPSYWIYADSGTDNETFEFTISIVSNQGDGWLNTTTKYIHQLQNLYFALTGEELTIKTTEND